MRHSIPLYTFLTLLLTVAAAPAAAQETPAATQEAPAAPSLESAAALMAAQDWPGAARDYRAVTAAEPDNGLAWFGLGSALYSSRQVDPALEAWEKALELGFQPPSTMLNLARCHAVKGDDDKAVDYLEQAAATGAGIFQAMTTMEEFQRFFGKERFQALVEELRPCSSPGYRLLDFWLGTWKVVDAEEQLLGTNSIVKILNGCALIENWSGVRGSEGKSLFFFHEVEKTWKQTWVTGGGQVKEKHLVAVLEGGAVRFQGEIKQGDGRVVLDRTTLVPLPEGRVRQVIEQSADGGGTWQTGFDAIYVPAD